MEKESIGNTSLKTIIGNIEEYNKENKKNYKEYEEKIFNQIATWAFLKEKGKNYYEPDLKYKDIESALKNFLKKMYDNRVSRFFSFLFWSDFKSTYRKIDNNNDLPAMLKTFENANLSKKSTMNQDNVRNLSFICSLWQDQEQEQDKDNKQDNKQYDKQVYKTISDKMEKYKVIEILETFEYGKSSDDLSLRLKEANKELELIKNVENWGINDLKKFLEEIIKFISEKIKLLNRKNDFINDRLSYLSSLMAADTKYYNMASFALAARTPLSHIKMAIDKNLPSSY